MSSCNGAPVTTLQARNLRPIVVQRAVPVLDGDTAAALSARILAAEHLAYPEALRRLLTEPWAVEGRRLTFSAGAA